MHKIEEAIAQIKKGHFVIVTDDEDRENEGDLIIAADLITPEAITFMAKKASGLICLSITADKASALNLPLQEHGEHTPKCHTAFTYSIDARFGITTGISSVDRTHTIKTVMRDETCPADIVIPGHIFPLIAKNNGVLERPGHTEAAVDLARLAGLKPAGVICEIMNDQGEMISGQALQSFAQEYNIPMISIKDLIEYRTQKQATPLSHEKKISIKIASQTELSTIFGVFKMITFFHKDDHREHIALIKGDVSLKTATVRVHSECLSGDVFSSLHCDCGHQLDKSLSILAESSLGVLIYLKQEGRDIGLTNKLRAYQLQQQGLDTVQANQALGLPIDNRNFNAAIDLLKHYAINEVHLLTNNPDKLFAFENAGFKTNRLSLIIQNNQHNQKYLATKKEKLAHLL